MRPSPSSDPFARRVVRFAPIATAAIVVCAGSLIAGPINPPAGPVGSTLKALSEVEPRTVINTTNTPGDADSVCRIIQPGSYYLAGNLSGASGKSGIEIVVSNVTIDLAGFTLQGVTGSLDGIRTSNAATHKITIRNGSITGWAGSGINLTQGGPTGASVLIEGVHAFTNTGDGIAGGYSSVVRACTATSNGGRGIVAQDGSVVEGCTARQSGGDGILVERGSAVSGCTAQDNAGSGIHGNNGCAVSRSNASGNTQRGIYVSITGTVADCTAMSNTGSGIYGSGGVSVTGCASSSNGSRGIEVHSGCTVSGCSAFFNTSDGIWAEGGATNLVTGNLIVNNTCVSNGAGGGDGNGIRVTNTGTRVEGNNCTNNLRGVHVLNAGNIFVRNTCSGNTTNWVAVTGNFLNVITATNGGSINGNSGGFPIGNASTDPNANFTY